MLVKCSRILWYVELVSGDIVCHSKQIMMLMIVKMMTTVMMMMCKFTGIYGGRKGEYCLWRYQCRYRQQLLGSSGQISLLCSFSFVMEHMKIQVQISWEGQSTANADTVNIYWAPLASVKHPSIRSSVPFTSKIKHPWIRSFAPFTFKIKYPSIRSSVLFTSKKIKQ